MLFKEFMIDSTILQGIDDAGFERCMPVQEESYKHTLEGRDILVQSQTGSGKTAAFVVPLLQKWVASEGKAKALILAPTRELVAQIEEEIQLLGAHLDITSLSIFGGVGYQQQEKALAKGVDILIATPGRLQDFVKQKKIDLRTVTQIVIDEADRLFDMGFYPDIQQIMKWSLPREERQTMLYSATLSVKVRNLAWQFMNNPVELEIEPEVVTVDTIDQVLYHVSGSEKLPLLLGLLKKEAPKNAIIFCNTKKQAEILAKRLEINGYPTKFLMGDLPQRKRLQIIKQVKEGVIPFLVATDVAARGLHVDDLEMVVNYDIPEDPENYVHRIGRTARAGKSGKAITFGCDKYVFGLESVESYIGNKIPLEWAGEDMFLEDKSKDQYIETFQDRSRSRNAGDRNNRRSQHGRSKSSSGRDQGRRDSNSRDKRDGDSQKFRSDRRDKRKKSPQKESSAQRNDYKRNNLSTMSDQERMEYYKKKYGESFGSDTPKGGQKQRSNKTSQSRNRNNQNKKSYQNNKGSEGKKQQPVSQEQKKSATTPKTSQPQIANNNTKKPTGVLGKIRRFFGGK